MIEILTSIFIFSALLNFIWEYFHSRLYKTCEGMDKKELSNLLTVMSLKDAFFITLFYFSVSFLTMNVDITTNGFHLFLFSFMALSFSFIDESVSVKYGRWEYNEKMPKIFGVGLTPLLEVWVTGLIAIYITFFLF